MGRVLGVRLVIAGGDEVLGPPSVSAANEQKVQPHELQR